MLITFDMALAGWKTKESTEALPGVLNLAASSGMGLAEASDLVTDYLSAFGEKAGQAGRMADVLAYAQANSNTTTAGLGEAFKNCAANANAFGLDIEQTTALIGKLSDQGLKGSEAGTALSAVFRDITQKMDDGKIKIGKTSVAVQDANGNYRSMTDILADVEKATDGMGDAQKNAALMNTFTSDSLKALNILLQTGSGNIEDFENALRKSKGSAEDMAKTMNDNLEGDLKTFKSALEECYLTMMEKLDPALRAIVKAATGFLNAFSSLPQPVMIAIMAITGFLAVMGPLLLITGSVIKQIITIKEAIDKFKAFKAAGGFVRIFNVALSPLRTALLGIANIITGTVIPALQSLWAFLLANPIVLVIVAIVALIAIFTQLWNHCEEFRNFWENLCDNIIDAATNISPALGATVKGIIQIFEGLINAVQTIFKGVKNILKDLFSGDFDKIGEDFSNMISQLGVNFGEVFDGIKNIAQNAIDGIYDLMVAGLNKLFDPIINWGMSINGHLGDVFIDIYGIFRDGLKLVKDFVKDNMKIIGDLLSGNWDGAAKDIEVFFKHLGSNIGLIFGDIKMAIQDAFLAITSAIAQQAQEIWGNITNWFSTKISQLGDFLQKALDLTVQFLNDIPNKVLYMLGYLAGVVARGLVELWNFVTITIPQWLEQIGLWLSELPNRVWEWLANTYNEVVEWAGQMWSKAQETGQQFVENCITWIQTLPDRIWNWLITAYNNVTSWAGQMWNKAVQAGSNFVNGVIQYLQSLPGRIWTWLSNTIQKAVTFAQQFAAKGKKAADDFKSKIVNGVKSIPSRMATLGGQIVQGLWNGIKGMVSWLKDKISGWADTIMQGFRDGFGIHSPSKRMAEEIGKFLPPGLTVGVKMSADAALKSIRDFSDQVMQAAQLGDLTSAYSINTGEVSMSNIVNERGTISAINELKRTIQQQNKEIDYAKLKDCFVEGATKIDSTIYMDKEVVGKKVAEPVRTTNALVIERLNRLEGK